tara:strand:- start:7520 stop:8965 length:1446 start_codon:yes stop_codon:yes gene_type:complete
MPPTVPYSWFKKNVIDVQVATHGDDHAAIEKGIQASLKQDDGEEIIIVDEEGTPVEIETITLGMAKQELIEPEEDEKQDEEEATSGEASYSLASIKNAVRAELKSSRDHYSKEFNRISGGDFRNDDRKKFGWKHFGEMAVALKSAKQTGGIVDKRFHTKTAPTTFGVEGVGADGGFAVPPYFVDEIMVKVQGEDSLLSRTDQLTTPSNNASIPIDETTPWQTSGGILANWEGEGDQRAQSKPNLKQANIRLSKLSVLVGVTDELQEDVPLLGQYLTRKAGEKMDFKINLAIVQGTGAGQPLGILNSGATVSVAKTASQDADTVVANNVIDMWSRCYGPSRRNAVWLINQDIEPQLNAMSIPGKDITGTAVTGYGGVVYLPANGLSDTPFSTLMGRPVIPTQACETLGDAGDIVLADLSQYLSLVKSQGVQSAQSADLWFDYDVTAFKFTMRMHGMPWLSSTIAVRDGSATLSPFVTLAVRS